MTTNLLDHLYLPTLVRLAAELLTDHGNDNTDSPHFRTEAAAAAYAEVLTAGLDRCGIEFTYMVDDALAAAA